MKNSEKSEAETLIFSTSDKTKKVQRRSCRILRNWKTAGIVCRKILKESSENPKRITNSKKHRGKDVFFSNWVQLLSKKKADKEFLRGSKLIVRSHSEHWVQQLIAWLSRPHCYKCALVQGIGSNSWLFDWVEHTATNVRLFKALGPTVDCLIE